MFKSLSESFAASGFARGSVVVVREFFTTAGDGIPNFDRMRGNSVCRQIPWDDDPEKLRAWTAAFLFALSCFALLLLTLHHYVRNRNSLFAKLNVQNRLTHFSIFALFPLKATCYLTAILRIF